MFKAWIGCNAQNFKAGRGDFHPEAVAIHRSGGSLTDIDTRCGTAGTFSSAHYAVGTDGTVHQYVEETDTAFHAGVVVNATWALIKPGQNPNFYTIGIELEGKPGDGIAEAQYAATAGLIGEIAVRWQFTVDERHIVLHDEIRAGRNCPGAGFDRQQLLRNMPAPNAQQPDAVAAERQIRIMRDSNVREGAPSTSARIVRVAAADSTETAAGFTDQGERVQGNSYWYRLLDGNYIWAGATDAPNPIAVGQHQAVSPPVSAVPAAAAAISCGIPRIDQLMKDVAAPALNLAESDPPAVGAVQDLLTGLGFSGLPTVLSAAYGVCGPKTTAAVGSFRQQQALPQSAEVDAALLRKMVAAPASDPRASAAYLTLVLGFPPSGMQKVLSLVSQMEGAGKFAALNPNTDRAGLSFGLIQWAQRPGRLAEVLAAMSAADRGEFVTIFGSGDEAVADALISHCRKPSGGVAPGTGQTVNPSFDLIADPWISRFRKAALTVRFQQTQVQLAMAAFQASYEALRRFAPDIRSERGVGFMLDVANQFGDAGTQKLYVAVAGSGMSEMEILEAIADATVEKIQDALKTGVRARRDHFLQTPLLSSDAPFSEVQSAAANVGS